MKALLLVEFLRAFHVLGLLEDWDWQTEVDVVGKGGRVGE